MLTAFLIDDDPAFQIHLKELLAKDHADIKVTEVFENPEDALIALKASEPEMIFLDVEMPGLTGMQLLEHFPQRNFEVVFTTSHDKYAFNAIKQEAIDYLLKPVNRIELATAIEKIKTALAIKKMQATATPPNPKIPLYGADGIVLIEVKSIMRCEADNNYSTFFMIDGKKIVATKTIGDLEEQLKQYHFFRSHKSHLINLHYVERVMKTDGGFIVMSDQTEVPLARGKKEELMNLISRLG